MKKSSLLKGIVVVILSIVLVASLVSYASAADDFNWDTPVSDNTSNNANANSNTNTNQTTTPAQNTNVNANTLTTNNSNTANTATTNTNTNTGSVTANLTTNTSSNNTNNNVDSLAYTGIGDNSILAIVIVLGLIVAVYSYKKVREYNSL